MSDDKQAEIKKNYNSIPKWRWWCYGCTNSLHAHKSKSDQDSPCCGCIGYSNKPYEHWAMNNMICNHIIGDDNSDNQQREVPEDDVLGAFLAGFNCCLDMTSKMIESKSKWRKDDVKAHAIKSWQEWKAQQADKPEN